MTFLCTLCDVQTDVDAPAPRPPRSDVLARWLPLAGWIAVSAAGSASVGRALEGRSTVAEVVVSAAAWLAVGAGLLAALVPSVASLVATRLLATWAVVAAVASWVAGHGGSAVHVLALGCAVAHLVGAMSAAVGEQMVQASAYGAERRLPLKPPVVALLPLVVMWTLTTAALFTGVLLLAGQRWLWGPVALGIGLAGGWLLAGLCYRLARRWLVVVPSGVVVHDHVALAETLMVTTPKVRSAALAEAGTEAADLSGPAPGHLIELRFAELTTVLLPVDRDHPAGRAIHAQSVLVAPSRPGRALRALGERRITVG
jgi:hypothetical protein